MPSSWVPIHLGTEHLTRLPSHVLRSQTFCPIWQEQTRPALPRLQVWQWGQRRDYRERRGRQEGAQLQIQGGQQPSKADMAGRCSTCRRCTRRQCCVRLLAFLRISQPWPWTCLEGVSICQRRPCGSYRPTRLYERCSADATVTASYLIGGIGIAVRSAFCWLLCTCWRLIEHMQCRLVADPAMDNLLHLHDKKTYTAKHGVAGNPAVGSRGPR